MDLYHFYLSYEHFFVFGCWCIVECVMVFMVIGNLFEVLEYGILLPFVNQMSAKGQVLVPYPS